MMDDWTPADFRACREGIGLTQIDIAGECHVRVLQVKRWEKGEAAIPMDAWETLSDWMDRFDSAVETAIAVAQTRAAVHGEIGTVELTYYRTQADYDEHGRDKGPFGFVNAVTRKVADELEAMGADIRFVYPEDRMAALDETMDKED